MQCEKCKSNMKYFCEGSVQGWLCPLCGEEIITTYIDPMSQDATVYRIYIRSTAEINSLKIKLISQLSGVNYITARNILVEGDACVFEARAREIKNAATMLDDANISFVIVPEYNY